MSTRRGACPTLHEPMETGDGLLVRLSPAGTGWTPAELSALASAAARFGSGMIEVTSRGNLQIRGLTSESAARLAEKVEAAEIPLRTGLAIDTGPLAGIDAHEIADPLPLARDLQEAVDAAGLTERLAPKCSVVIDGRGALSMDDVIADIRLTAEASAPGDWQIAVGGTARSARAVGIVSGTDAILSVLMLLGAIAGKGKAARARDLTAADLAGFEPAPLHGSATQASATVGRFPLKSGTLATAFALPFGQVDAATLTAFSAAVSEADAGEIRLSPGRGLIVPGLDAATCSALESKAAALGFITRADDPGLVIAACAGAPFCAAAYFATRELGAEIARAAPKIVSGRKLHISGCEKRCAEPAAPDFTILGSADGCLVLHGDGRKVRSGSAVAPGEALAALRRVADRQWAQENPPARMPLPAGN